MQKSTIIFLIIMTRCVNFFGYFLDVVPCLYILTIYGTVLFLSGTWSTFLVLEYLSGVHFLVLEYLCGVHF